MDPAIRAAAVAVVLLGLPVRPLPAQEPATDAHAQGSDERYFQPPGEWRFELGTDTTFTLSQEGEHSTNETNDHSSNFDAVHARLYARLHHRDSVELVVDLFTANGADPSVYGLYVRLQPDRRFGVRVGILPLVVGGWQDRAYPQRQPLINQPLMAQYILPLRNDGVPASTDELLAQRGRRGETRYPLGFPGTGSGVALYYEHCWNPGLEFLGEWGDLRYRAAVMAGPPGSPLVHAWDLVAGPSFEARLTWRLGESARLGGSFARGPYLQDRLDAVVPSGHQAADYDQRIVGADLRVGRGRIEANAEYAWNTLDSPFVPERLGTHAGYAEAALRIAEGLHLAARASALRHTELEGSQGRRLSWEADSERLELGAVYRLLERHVSLKAGWQRTWLDVSPRLVEDVAAVQVAISY